MSMILNPVWPACPPICETAHLPSLKTLPELMLWLSKNGPGCYVSRMYQCSDCGYWHAEISPRDPSGDSSGCGRSHKT